MKFETTDFEFLKPMIQESLESYFIKKEKNDFEMKLYNITQTAEMLHKTYNWVVARINDGTFKTTIDGKHITGKEINRYLGE